MPTSSTSSDIKQRAIREAKDLLSTIGAQDRVPIPLDKIIDYLDYRVLAFQGTGKNTQNVSGAVDRGKRIIYVNSNDRMPRQRFTIAHEIGHILLNKDITKHVDFRVTPNKDPNETAMDCFAAELLMPEKIFKKYWKKLNKNIIETADIFVVSLLAVKIRVSILGI